MENKIIGLLEEILKNQKEAQKIDNFLMAPVIRNVDNLGRLTIPKEYRRLLDIENSTSLEVAVIPEGILIRKKL